MLAICGIVRTSVITMSYSPFHAFISRRMRSMRSMRSTRRKVSLIPAEVKMYVSVRSTIEMRTMVPSSVFQPSAQYEAQPTPKSLSPISTMKR